MRKLMIDRKVWLRGEGTESSCLLRCEDNKMCCVGIFLSSVMNVPTEELLGNGTARFVLGRRPTVANESWLREGNLQSDIGTLYETNDARGMSDTERETRIAELFAKHDVEVEFIN